MGEGDGGDAANHGRDTRATLQGEYYARTAEKYDSMHVDEKDEHFFALGFLKSAIDFFEVGSVLDVGAGTGRAVVALKAGRPGLRVMGVEPVKELIEMGRRKGLGEEELVQGDATGLEFGDGAFDMVCAFGVMHHIRRPELAVGEMLRVAKVGIFISDSNNFGQGSSMARGVKQALNALGLWRAADWIKTRGKGFHVSEGDGVYYSYSLFNNYAQIRRVCRRVHVLNTEGSGINPYRTAGHVALLGIK